ncbi:MAG: hypothetical protein ED557_02660 [Balneola sp.]|nr:MAG: hypothetical protein ED557_02660 [Balneola sp.]
MSRPKVTRCICYDISFAEVKKIAVDEGLTSVEELREKDICCNNCLMCEPYVELVLETGNTEFELGVFVSES